MRFLSSLTVFCLLLQNILTANMHLGPCEWGLQGELLYWQPAQQNSNGFTAISTDASTTTRIVNTPSYRPGFRIEGFYGLNCLNDVHARFTYFNSGNNRRSVTGLASGFLPVVGTFENNLTFRYYAVEGLWGRWLFAACDFDLELQAGLLYSNIRFRDSTDDSTLARTFIRQSTFWGIGPEVAIDFKYPLPLCFCGTFAIAVDARAALLTSRSTIEFIDIRTTSTSFVDSDPYWDVTPMADFRLGLNWSYPCSCFKTNLEVGYEWVYYQNVIEVSSNITFQGPYLALGVAF